MGRCAGAAAQVLGLATGQRDAGVQDAAELHEAAAVRRRFLELSVLVHPDKCRLPSAEKANPLSHRSKTSNTRPAAPCNLVRALKKALWSTGL